MIKSIDIHLKLDKYQQEMSHGIQTTTLKN